MGGEPGEQGGVGNAGLAPEVHDRELARAQEPGKRLRADAQPALRFFEGDQLRRRGELQGEVRLPRGRAASGRGVWTEVAWPGFPSQCRACDPGSDGLTAPSGLGRDRGDSTNNLC